MKPTKFPKKKKRKGARKLADLEAHTHFLANAEWLFDRHWVVYFFRLRSVVVHGNRASSFRQRLHELVVPRQNSHGTFVQQRDSVCTLFARLPLHRMLCKDAHYTREECARVYYAHDYCSISFTCSFGWLASSFSITAGACFCHSVK